MDNFNLTKSMSKDSEHKYLLFWTENQLFGVPISDVVQIIGMQEITSVPDFPNYAKGVINLRGTIIPLIDVRIRFHKEEIAYQERTCVIVTKIKESNIGFIVDGVDEVADIDDKDISAPPTVSSDSTNKYLTGIAKVENKVVLLLDVSKVLNLNELEQVNSICETI